MKEIPSTFITLLALGKETRKSSMKILVWRSVYHSTLIFFFFITYSSDDWTLVSVQANSLSEARYWFLYSGQTPQYLSKDRLRIRSSRVQKNMAVTKLGRSRSSKSRRGSVIVVVVLVTVLEDGGWEVFSQRKRRVYSWGKKIAVGRTELRIKISGTNF